MLNISELLKPFTAKDSSLFVEFDAKSNDVRLTPHFTLHEFLTKDPRNSYTYLSKALITAVCDARYMIGAPIWINSTYRSHVYNQQVRGASNSFHKKGMAIDLACDPRYMRDLLSYMLTCKLIGGVGVYKSFLHIDRGPERLFVG